MNGPKGLIGPHWPLAIRYFARLYLSWAFWGAGTMVVLFFMPHVVSTLWNYVAIPERTLIDIVAFVTFGSVAVFASVVVLIALRALVRRAEHADFLETIAGSVEPTSRLLSRVEWAEGTKRHPGVISCRDDRFFFENSDVVTSFNARHIDYDTGERLPDGQAVEVGKRVLMIRSGDTAFHFVVDREDADEWRKVLNLVVVRRREEDSAEAARSTAS